MHIFVSWPGFDRDGISTGRRLVDAGHELVLAPKLGNRTPDELVRLAAGCAGAIVSTDPFTAEVLGALPDLRVIARVGVGFDSIDRAMADELGIAISITPGMNAETVADHTLALILSAVRKIPQQDSSVKAGRWDRVGPLTPGELPGKTVGLVGAGTIGRAVARRLHGFGVDLCFFDAQVDALSGAEKVGSLAELLGRSDIVSLHVPLVAETTRLIDGAAIARMKPTAILVNTSRGPVLDQQAVFQALRDGRLGGAALDVFETEPPGADALRDVPNLVCAAHMGGISYESIDRMTASATQSVLDVLEGRFPNTVVNREAIRGHR
ncbi:MULTISPECIES: phosphoglycerate dehydrogenase [unclassified Mesorhizobium]|uniref:phosphoglycerate dehydrogenase n=1 Tax=unclassified Mesorhizobium TaxID=325217 RepID=UPI000FCBA91C|nr:MULTISPECIES: phosphoglycerate dehydrogenase [unclassified Mesorhizobium]RUW32857.1 hydroxyacid dehydrogenase [Mesorhizobium sp. M1E.F.Ca.ET.041.01.1.1]RWD84917.1 MAG: hydroxyacid dehydrogenase [Mesorhizobium sp.]RWD90042.1 MAG: hydroxyacid dehydrogenase [Mesorhizobium sp.]TIV54163.1 MAG: hydroxyacid dehydrogenase [Mesorhizobium sp.]